MKILMTGGSGFLGSALRRRLESAGDSITCLSRTRRGVEGGTTFVDDEALFDIGPHDGVINLAGESVAGLWTKSKRHSIARSRIDTTLCLAEWIEKSSVKPSVLLSGSAVGIYGDRGREELTETSDVSRVPGFLAKVCRDWEQAAASAAWRGVRTVQLRTGQVLGRGGGFLGAALPLMRRFPMIVFGSPEAYFPWVALEDWVELTLLALRDEAIVGPLNLSAPRPATHGEFTAALASRLRKRVWGSVPRWALKLGAGEFGESLAASQRVLPAKALEQGYRFQFPSLEGCLDALIP